ncbi:Puromycin N-acetyltransferase [Colletotrichum trifolii]|uniref:Puromycin N-acetyltransferase n=1 Tax=Colletotrichum trifolii TaxID=5466 RepID=A0A4R8QXV0_COLTR|nr:Puromycin N-acetyltransferase [Colletotrichum trifolii]
MTEPELRIRPGASADLAEAADVWIAAFGDDWIIRKLHPKRSEYPQDFRSWAHRFFYGRFWGPEQQMLHILTVPDAKLPSGERIAAFSWWRRPYPTPADKAAVEGNLTIRGWLKPVLLGINKLAGYLWPARSADVASLNMFDDSHLASDDILNDPAHPKRKNAWYLSTLAVSPDFQGKGYGSVLVREGLRQSDKEGVTAWLIGLRGVEPFYERLGFETKGRANVGRLADWDGGSIMLRE